MPKYYSVIIDGDGGVLEVEPGASIIFSGIFEPGSIIIDGVANYCWIQNGAQLRIGETGVANANMQLESNSWIRLIDTSQIDVQSGAEINLDDGIPSGGSTIYGNGNIHLGDGRRLYVLNSALGGILLQAGELTLEDGARLQASGATAQINVSGSGAQLNITDGEMNVSDAQVSLGDNSITDLDGSSGNVAYFNVGEYGLLRAQSGGKIQATGSGTEVEVTGGANLIVRAGAGSVLKSDAYETGNQWQLLYQSTFEGGDTQYRWYVEKNTDPNSTGRFLRTINARYTGSQWEKDDNLWPAFIWVQPQKGVGTDYERLYMADNSTDTFSDFSSLDYVGQGGHSITDSRMLPLLRLRTDEADQAAAFTPIENTLYGKNICKAWGSVRVVGAATPTLDFTNREQFNIDTGSSIVTVSRVDIHFLKDMLGTDQYCAMVTGLLTDIGGSPTVITPYVTSTTAGYFRINFCRGTTPGVDIDNSDLSGELFYTVYGIQDG